MLPTGFEPTISAGERPQSYSLDPEAIRTGTDYTVVIRKIKLYRGLVFRRAIESVLLLKEYSCRRQKCLFIADKLPKFHLMKCLLELPEILQYLGHHTCL